MNIGKYRESLARRIALVALGLAMDPWSIPTYVAALNKQPLDLGLPWISAGAIRFLAQFLRPDMRVFEYGAGGSTVFFADRCRSVTAVEDDPAWAERVSARVQERGNGTVLFRPTEEFKYRADGSRPYTYADFAATDYVHAIDGFTPDVVMIDGSEDWHLEERRRTVCFRHIEPIMRPGGIVVLDDSWAYPELRTSHRAKRVRCFWGLGPCRRGVTSTDVFFY